VGGGIAFLSFCFKVSGESIDWTAAFFLTSKDSHGCSYDILCGSLVVVGFFYI